MPLRTKSFILSIFRFYQYITRFRKNDTFLIWSHFLVFFSALVWQQRMRDSGKSIWKVRILHVASVYSMPLLSIRPKIKTSWYFPLHNYWLSRRCCWRVTSTCMWRCCWVGGFRHSESAAFLRNMGGYSSTDTASHLEDQMLEIIPWRIFRPWQMMRENMMTMIREL